MKRFWSSVFILILLVPEISGQLTVTEGSAMNLTPHQLVQQWLIGSGLTVTNATFNGSSDTISSNQIGTFVAAGTAGDQLGLGSGVLMTSGQASLAIGPNSSSGAGLNTNGGGDPDLTAIAGNNTWDKCIIEFDFVPLYDTLRFRYVFASDEFYNYCNQINDAFGFFLSGPGITGPYTNNAVNIALMPNTSNPVTINNVCNDNSSNWCNEPGNPTSLQNCSEASGVYFEYDALTYVFVATYVLIPCSTYHIKLAIGDAADHILDSGVFLEKNSFLAVGLTVQNSFTVPSVGNFAVEGCSEAVVSFVLPNPAPTPYTINYTIGGTATNGVDYTTIPNSITIPSGEDSAAIVITPFFDGIPEGDETVVLGIDQPSCTGGNILYDTIYIRDNSTLVAFAGSDDTICLGDTVTLSALATGGASPYGYQWNVGAAHLQTVQYVPTSPGEWFFNVLVSDGCGQTDRDTLMIYVKALPYLTNTPSSATICSGETSQIILQSTFPGATYTWTAQNPSGTLTGIGPGAGGVISQTPGNPLLTWDSVLYHITPFFNGCAGPDSVFKLYVKPLPSVTFPGAGSALCSGQTTTISMTADIAGSAISWSSVCSNPQISGYGAGTGNLISETLINTSPLSDTVFYTASATAAGCTGPDSMYFVVVNPVPVVETNPMTDTLCSEEFTQIILTASCPGVSYDWTATQVAGNVTGYAGGSGPAIIQQLANQLPTDGSVHYTITPYTLSCAGNDTVYTVLVKPAPALLNTPLRDTICNLASTNLTLLPDVTGATFSWTCVQLSGLITGWSGSAAPSVLIDQQLTNAGFQRDSVTYLITPQAAGCSGEVYPFVFHVFPTPDLTITPPNQSICSGESTSLALSSQVAGTSFTWTSLAGPDIAGNTNGNGNLITDTLINLGTLIETVLYSVTPVANSCPPGTTSPVTVTVRPVPVITNTQTAFFQCNQSTTNIALQNNLTYPVTYGWKATGSSGMISGFSDGSGPVIAQTLINSATTDQQVYYKAAPFSNGCTGDSLLFTVTVRPTPDIAPVPAELSVCSGEQAIIQLTSQVTGTEFSWTASANKPGLSGFSGGTGSQIIQTVYTSEYAPGIITYQITPSYQSCTGPAGMARITVRPVPEVSLAACIDTITTTNARPVYLRGGIPAGGSWYGPGISGRTFDPAVAGAGTHEIRYTYVNTFGCQDSSTRMIRVMTPPPFICGDTLQDPRDQKRYPTIAIGSQCWMASNLNFGQNVSASMNQRDNCIPEKFCFNDNPDHCDQFGGLYQWDEIMLYRTAEGTQGICPPGWHIPSENEWLQMFTTFPPYYSGGAGAALKYTGFSGFNAFTEGLRFNNSTWRFSANDPALRSAAFWTSTLRGSGKALAHALSEVVADTEYSPSVSTYPASRNQGFYLRCIKD